MINIEIIIIIFPLFGQIYIKQRAVRKGTLMQI